MAFQPHQYQRTLLLLESFAASLAAADVTLVTEIYGARESDEIMASVSAVGRAQPCKLREVAQHPATR